MVILLKRPAPGRDEDVDQYVILTDSVSTRASFGTDAECFSTLESTTIACNTGDASMYQTGKEVFRKALNPKNRHCKSPLREL